MPDDLTRTIKAARERVLYLSRVTPEIFPQWQALQQAKHDLDHAKERYDRALKTWTDYTAEDSK